MRQWRVGTFSMGILLIAVGVLLIIGKINGVASVNFILKWWPIIIILLGIEILLFAYFSKSEPSKIKYDGFSIFIILLVIGFSMGAYIVSTIPIENHGNLVFNGFGINSKYETNVKKNVKIDLKDRTKLSIENAYGNIEIVKSLDKKVEVTAEITIRNNDEQYSKEVAEKLLEVSETNVKDEIKIISKAKYYIYDKSKIQSLKVNLKIWVPDGIEVVAQNEYGDVSIKDVSKSLKVYDKNGKIVINSVGGDLTIESEFGDIEAREIKGNCDIKNRNAKVIVNSVGRNLVVENQFGDVEARKIKGECDINNKNARVDLKDVGKSAKIENEFGDVEVDGIIGSLNLEGKNENMTLNNIGGNVMVENEFGNVKLSKANKAIDIINRNGNIEISSDVVIKGDLRIQNEYGNIKLRIPKNQNCFVNAYTIYGEIKNDFSLKVEEQTSERTVSQQLGDAGIRIDLKNNNGNIEIR